MAAGPECLDGVNRKLRPIRQQAANSGQSGVRIGDLETDIHFVR
jgi:hypothetical protein